jgi:hypothetical protein
VNGQRSVANESVSESKPRQCRRGWNNHAEFQAGFFIFDTLHIEHTHFVKNQDKEIIGHLCLITVLDPKNEDHVAPDVKWANNSFPNDALSFTV